LYEHVLAEIKFAPEQVLFIDDNLQNIEGAKSLGIQTIHLGIEEELIDHSFFKQLEIYGH